VDLGGGHWIHARTILRQDGRSFDVSVVLTPRGGRSVTVVSELPLPTTTAYEGRVFFGARAGGETADHDIDNVMVQFLDENTSVLSFSNTYYSAAESDPSVVVTVVRAGSLANAVQVEYATADGSASAESDYDAASGTLQWGPGDASPKSFSIRVLDDAV